MGLIRLNRVRIYAFHGCLEEEGKIGGDYYVDVALRADFIPAAKTDALSKTIDYVEVNRIIREEMAVRSKLIETVALRMLDRLKNTFPILESAEVTITKISPPLSGQVESVSLTLEG